MRRILTLFGIFAMLLAVPLACGPQGGEEPATEPEETEVTEVMTPTEAAEAPDEDMPEGAVDVMAFEPAAPGGTLVIAQGQEPDTLYLWGGSMLAGTHIQHSLYDGPYEGLNYDYQPVILESLPKIDDGSGDAVLSMVTVADGEKYIDPETQEVVTATAEALPGELEQISVTWTLKPGLTWQDGTPVTAEDSVFSRMLACHPDSPSTKFTCDRTLSYEATADNQVTWTGLPGFTDQTYYINFYTPLPRHQPGSDGTLMADMEPAAILTDEAFTRSPWSYGPFKIDEWESGDHITLSRNENYWRASEGLPFLDTVIHRFIEDSNALLAAVKTDDAQVGTQDGLDISQAETLDAAEAAGELTPWYVTGTVWEHIDFNVNPTDERVPVGACKAVRQAMATGTDRASMVEVIQMGKTEVQNTFVPSAHWAYPASGLTTYEYDVEAAKQMLADAGFADGDGDGTLEATADVTCDISTDVEGGTKSQLIPAGTPLAFTLNTTAGNVMREETTLLFQQNMKDIGIDVTLEYLAADVFFADGPDGPLFGRRFDLGEFAWLTGVQPPVGLYYCTEIPAEENSWAGQNQTGWCNPEYDRIGKQAENTLSRDESLPMYSEAQAIFSDELPVIPLFARVKVMATNPNLVNFMPNATVNSETWNIETWGYAESATQ
jgi:peptide/nickel transport system substrate-binding protein